MAPDTLLAVEEEIIGDALVEQIADENDGLDVHTELTQSEITLLRNCIASTIRPVWNAGPPKNLGEAGHGKLKADQWRSCIEFDVPVFLAETWSGEITEDDEPEGGRHRALFDSTMFLAIAIRWGTSHVTSERHAMMFTHYMEKYLQSLRTLRPDLTLHPNHHNALHIGENLLRYGPMHGFWMFPFERVIGKLQQINTNQKLGMYDPRPQPRDSVIVSLRATGENYHGLLLC